MKSLTRFLLPLFALFILIASAAGVAFARETEGIEPSRSFVNESEIFGTVESIAPQAWVVDGLTLAITSRTEIDDAIQVGHMVKIHLFVAADGKLTAREIELSMGTGDDANGNDNLDDDDDGNDNAWDDGDDNVNDNSGDDDGDDNGNDNSGDDDDDDDDDNDNSGDDDDDEDDDDDDDDDD